jgi:hypothetical protein
MDAAVRIDDAAELAHLETESGVFEWLLHLAALEEAQITSGACGRAVPTRKASRKEQSQCGAGANVAGRTTLTSAHWRARQSCPWRDPA